MAREDQKSGATIALDVIRYLAIVISTIWITYVILQHSWVWAVAAAIPIGLVMLNAWGFVTLPLYRFTPENRLKARAYHALMCGDVAEGDRLTKEFQARFSVNVPTDSENV